MGRAGTYKNQPTGYRAFSPAPLPPEPPVDLGGDLQLLLSSADLALGRLDGSVQTLPNPDLFVRMYVKKEAVLSSQIEGTQSSLHDLLAAEAAALGTDRIPRDVDEVINYVAAMKLGLARLPDLPLSVRLIREIHARLMEGARGGHLTPGELPTALSDLERYLHSDDGLPLLVRIGLAHAQFETIHPFLDGNGRVGRLLITLLLCEQGVLSQPVLYLSRYLKANRAEYYDRLQRVRDEGDWEGWLRFFLRGVAQVSAEATETARRILALREEHRRLVTAHFGRAAANGHRLLDLLCERPIISGKQVQEHLGVTAVGAAGLVTRLTELGLVLEITGQKRNRRWRYEPYVALFA